MNETWIVILIDRRGLGHPIRGLGERKKKRTGEWLGLRTFTRDDAREEASNVAAGWVLSRRLDRVPLLVATCQVDGPGYEVIGDRRTR